MSPIPANTEETTRSVVDFGLVRSLERGTDESLAANVVTGTPLYLSPEAISAPDTVDGRADIYAVGAVAYYLLTGQHVFEGETVVEICSKHLLAPPIHPSERLGRALPADLEGLILQCLAKDRAERPASAAALRSALLACAAATEYDVAAASAWWAAHRATSAQAPQPASSSGSAPTMAVDLSGRPGASTLS